VQLTLNRFRPRVGFALTILAIAAGGCGSSSDDNSSTNSAAAPSGNASSLPAAVRDKGKLVVASDASYPPMESLAEDGKTVVGFDADLAAALGKDLGIDVDVVNATFDGILPGLASGKYDVGLSSFTATAEREKSFDMVTYFEAGTSYFAKAGSPPIDNLDQLCGKTVAVEKGTTQVDQLTAQSNKCESAHSKPIKQLVFPDQNGANLALSSGRAELSTADSPVAAYLVKRSKGQFELSPKIYETAPYAIAAKKDTGMAKALLGSMKRLIDDGTYGRLLSRWGLSSAAIKTPQLNVASSG